MNHEIMTIEEVAAYLRISERTVYEWAQKGHLPGGKLGGIWRFKRSDIEGWVNRRLGASAKPPTPIPDLRPLSGILSPERIVFLNTSDKETALKTLCAMLGTSPLIHNPAELEQAVFRREQLMSTGIGFGVGVPHVRLSSVEDIVMALGISRQPLTDYSSLDNEPVQIVCMVAASVTQHPQYIRTLSSISSILRAATMREALVSAPDVLSVYHLFTTEEIS